MKKCNFCNHSGFTEKGEQVCTKYLLYVGEDKFEEPCSGFEFNLNIKRIVIAVAIMLLMITLLICGL